MRTCRVCKQELPEDSFGRNAAYQDNLDTRCRPCGKSYWDAYYAKNAETYRNRSKEWHANNPRQQRHRALLAKYGLSIDQFESMLLAQGGVCKICGKPETRSRNGKVYQLHVDHDHITGKVRALLCHHCNAGIGHFKDSRLILQRAVAYLTGVNVGPSAPQDPYRIPV